VILPAFKWFELTVTVPLLFTKIFGWVVLLLGIRLWAEAPVNSSVPVPAITVESPFRLSELPEKRKILDPKSREPLPFKVWFVWVKALPKIKEDPVGIVT